MKKALFRVLAVGFLIGLFAYAAGPTPVVRDTTKLKIRDAQVQYLRHATNLEALRSQYEQESRSQAAALAAVQAGIEEAYKEAKVSKEEYDFDAGTLAFIKKPDKPAPKPSAPK